MTVEESAVFRGWRCPATLPHPTLSRWERAFWGWRQRPGNARRPAPNPQFLIPEFLIAGGAHLGEQEDVADGALAG